MPSPVVHYGPVATVAESAPQAVGKPRGRRLPQYGWAGTLMALLLAWSSLTPSLLPRSTLLQGLLAGIAAAFGYGVGETVAWAVRRLSGWRPSRRRPRALAWSVARGRRRASSRSSRWSPDGGGRSTSTS